MYLLACVYNYIKSRETDRGREAESERERERGGNSGARETELEMGEREVGEGGRRPANPEHTPSRD